MKCSGGHAADEAATEGVVIGGYGGCVDEDGRRRVGNRLVQRYAIFRFIAGSSFLGSHGKQPSFARRGGVRGTRLGCTIGDVLSYYYITAACLAAT